MGEKSRVTIIKWKVGCMYVDIHTNMHHAHMYMCLYVFIVVRI